MAGRMVQSFQVVVDEKGGGNALLVERLDANSVRVAHQGCWVLAVYSSMGQVSHLGHKSCKTSLRAGRALAGRRVQPQS